MLRVDLDPAMETDQRFVLCSEQCARWPASAIERLVERTKSFADIFEVMASRGVSDVALGQGDMIEIVDRLVDFAAPSRLTSLSAVVVAWAGGVLHNDIYDELIRELRLAEVDPHDVRRAHRFVRLADRASQPRLADSGAARLSGADRRVIRECIVSGAVRLQDQVTDSVGRIGLLQPVWVMAELGDGAPDPDTTVLLESLADALLTVGDHGVARRIARFLAAESATRSEPLTTGVLRLLDQTGDPDDAYVPSEPGQGIEGRVFHTATLLRQSDRINDGVANARETVCRTRPRRSFTRDQRLAFTASAQAHSVGPPHGGQPHAGDVAAQWRCGRSR